MLTDDAMRTQVVAEARDHVLLFDWAEVARRTRALYTELAGTRVGAGVSGDRREA